MEENELNNDNFIIDHQSFQIEMIHLLLKSCDKYSLVLIGKYNIFVCCEN